MSNNDPYHRGRINAVETAIEIGGSLFDALIVIGSYRDRDGGTALLHMQVGNLHAIEGMMRERLRKMENYEAGFHAEEGRYDSVRIRQREQQEQREAGHDTP